MFNIYSIGDAAFFEQILIALAMIVGTNDFSQAAAIGMLIGVIILSLQNVFNPQAGLPYQQILVAWIIYAISFVPSTTVTIESAYDGEVRVVDNVPLGPAAVGALFSQLGYGLTSLYEQAFAATLPGAEVTSARFLDTLYIMNKLNHEMSGPSLSKALSKSSGSRDLRSSVYNYIRDCTMTKIDLMIMTHEEFKTRDIFSALPFIDKDFGTQMDLGEGLKDYDCEKGWNLLEEKIKTGLGSARFRGALQTVFNRDMSAEDMLQSVESAHDLLSGINSSANNMMFAMLVQPLYEAAASDRAAMLQVNNAAIQRNYQGAAEGSLFLTTVRPLLSFLEIFTYAFAPFMAFVLFFGAQGIAAVKKFLQIQIWIQLWLPIMAVLNLYVVMAATGELSALVNYDTEAAAFGSLAHVDTLQMKVGHYLGVAGRLGAAVPALALAVLFGGPVALSHLSGKLSGGDHFNEKNLAPDALERGALAKADTGIAIKNINGGTSSVGMNSTVANAYEWSASNMLASGAQSAQGSAIQAEQKAHLAIQDSFMNSLRSGREIGAMSEQQHNARMNNDKAYSSAYQILDSHAETKGWDDTQKRQAAEFAATEIGAGMSARMTSDKIGKALSALGDKALTIGAAGVIAGPATGGATAVGGAIVGTLGAGAKVVGMALQALPEIRGEVSGGVSQTARSVELAEQGINHGLQATLQKGLSWNENTSASAMEARMTAMRESMADTAGESGETRHSTGVTSALSTAETEAQEYRQTQAATTSVGSTQKRDMASAAQHLSSNGNEKANEFLAYYNTLMSGDAISDTAKDNIKAAVETHEKALGPGGGGMHGVMAKMLAVENASHFEGNHNAHAASVSAVATALGFATNVDAVEQLQTGTMATAANNEQLQTVPDINTPNATGANLTQEQREKLSGDHYDVNAAADRYRNEAYNAQNQVDNSTRAGASEDGYEPDALGRMTANHEQSPVIDRERVEGRADDAKRYADTLENIISVPARAAEWVMDNFDRIGMSADEAQELADDPSRAQAYLEDNRDMIAERVRNF